MATSTATARREPWPELARVEISAPVSAEQSRILTPDALAFVAGLHRRFNSQRTELLRRRVQVQEHLDGGWKPRFLRETEPVRCADWNVKKIPTDLRDRRVEITGPVDRKMIINALNSGANVFMADFEDSHSPTWSGTIDGQQNLMDAVRRTISYTSPQGKSYELAPNPATLMVRPRGWHLPEAHVKIDGEPVSASLFDFGLFFFHNAHELLHRGSGPYFYIPKLENHLEARLWNEVFTYAEQAVGIPGGAIKVTVLIETILAAFEMDEILYELREHIVGLNCGRWDYIFSFIKKFRLHDFALLPDRALVTMSSPFLSSYSELLIHTAHHRGAYAMGGMAAQIPVRQVTEQDIKAHQSAMRQVWNDKDREVTLGHDGTWVAHPGLVALARSAFDAKMKTASQLQVLSGHYHPLVNQLLEPPRGPITEAGVRRNLRVSLIYLESWLRGIGCVPIDHLMEDAATAEISRAQVWQWLRHPRAQVTGVGRLTEAIARVWMTEELEHALKDADPGIDHRFERARTIQLRGSIKIEYTLATRGAEKLFRLLKEPEYVAALGALTGNQAVQQIQAGLKAVYCSGWQVAADANLAGETYPDQSLYPCDSVPALVKRINRAFQRADQIQTLEGDSEIDWFAPIVADAEAGFGGNLNAFELMKAMIEAGAAAVHFEDQLAAAKKCGHMGGKVLVPTSEFVQKLSAARLAADVLDVPTLVIARTDANGAFLLTNDSDPLDHEFMTGERTSEGFHRIRGGIDCAIKRGRAYAPYAEMIWCETSEPNLLEAKRFAEGVLPGFPDKILAYNCSPSFNWKKKLDSHTIAKFQRELAAMGYRFQFVTLAGFHALNFGMFELAAKYSKDGMSAYADFQEREFKAEKAGYQGTSHQRFVGTGYFDQVTQTLTAGMSSTLALVGSTEEDQFEEAV